MSGRSNYAVQTDGSNDYIAFGNVLNMGTGNFSIECWVYYVSFISNGNHAVMKRTSAINAMYFLNPAQPGTNSPQFFTRNSGATSVVASGATGLSTSVWYHVAGVRDGSNVYVYLNGVQDGTGSGAAVNTDNSESLTVCADIANSKYTNMKIAELRIWNEARTIGDIQNNMFKRLTGSEANLGLYCPMDEGTGTTATDRSGNSRNGTLTNGPTWVEGPPIQGASPVLII